MKPKLGEYLFYTAPEESQLKPGPYPCVVVQPADGKLSVVVFGPGASGSTRLFDVNPALLSTDDNPYVAPVKKPAAPPGVAPKKSSSPGPKKSK